MEARGKAVGRLVGTGVGTTSLAAACSSRTGGNQVTRLPAIGAQVVIRPAAALLLGEGAANTSAAINFHGAGTVGWVLGWVGGLAAGVGV